MTLKQNETISKQLAYVVTTHDNTNSHSIDAHDEPIILKGVSAGFVEGATKIKQPTIRRYVNTFRDHFSPGAQIKTRGRRFTNRDIELLVFIREMYAAGKSTELVGAALAGEWKHKVDNQAASETIKLVLAAQEMMKSTRNITNKVIDRIQYYEGNTEYLEGLVSTLTDEVATLKHQMWVNVLHPRSLWERLLHKLDFIEY